MKLLQMLKLTKLRKWMKQQDKEPCVTVKNIKKMSGKEIFAELSRENKVGSMLADIMNEHKLSHGTSCTQLRQKPSPARQATVSLGQLAEFPPTQLRNIQKAFTRVPTALRYYSDQELNSLLIEWTYGNRDMTTYRKATPTTLITKKPGYKRKIDGKYNQMDTTTIINSWK